MSPHPRRIKDIVLILALLIAATTQAGASSQLSISDMNREETVVDWITAFDGLTDTELANANGSVIGLFAQWFRRSPHRTEDWFMLAHSQTVRAQAIVGLAMIDRRDSAVWLAETYNVPARAVWRAANFQGGNNWPPGGEGQTLSSVIYGIGSIDTLPIDLAWQQDLMWVSAFITRDPRYAHRVLASADLQMDAATKQDPKAYAFVAAALWSAESNAARFPFIADAIRQYIVANPNSATVRVLMSRQDQ